MKKITIVLTFVAGFALLFMGCATPKQELVSRLKVGQQKDEVLEIAGSPNQSWRQDGLEHWLYIYFVDDIKQGRVLVFKDGSVTKLVQHDFGDSLENKLKDSGSMKEYEEKVKKSRKQNESGNFKDLSED